MGTGTAALRSWRGDRAAGGTRGHLISILSKVVASRNQNPYAYSVEGQSQKKSRASAGGRSRGAGQGLSAGKFSSAQVGPRQARRAQHSTRATPVAPYRRVSGMLSARSAAPRTVSNRAIVVHQTAKGRE